MRRVYMGRVSAVRRTSIAAAMIVLGLVGAARAFAGTISPVDATSHIGQTVTVEGVVGEVFISRRGDTFLDFGGRYPHESFTGVIFRDDAGKFGDMRGLEGRRLDVTGKIKMYRGRPEIILRTPSQLNAK